MSYHVICHFAGILMSCWWGDQLRGASNPEGSHPFFQRLFRCSGTLPATGGQNLKPSNMKKLNLYTTRLECENLKRICENPWGFHGTIVYLPTIYHHKSTRQIYHTWIVWQTPCWKSQLTSFSLTPLSISAFQETAICRQGSLNVVTLAQ